MHMYILHKFSHSETHPLQAKPLQAKPLQAKPSLCSTILAFPHTQEFTCKHAQMHKPELL
jgi:hypothetical protein